MKTAEAIQTAKRRMGSTREEVLVRMGEPDRKGVTSLRYPEPRIWCYGDVELHFNLFGRLSRLYAEDEEGNPILDIDNNSPAA